MPIGVPQQVTDLIPMDLTGFSRVVAPVMARAMRRANRIWLNSRRFWRHRTHRIRETLRCDGCPRSPGAGRLSPVTYRHFRDRCGSTIGPDVIMVAQ